MTVLLRLGTYKADLGMQRLHVLQPCHKVTWMDLSLDDDLDCIFNLHTALANERHLSPSTVHSHLYELRHLIFYPWHMEPLYASW